MKFSNPKKIDKSQIKNIIFDWGGVITNLDFNIPNNMFAELGIANFKEQFSKYSQIHLLQDLETGAITPEHAIQELKANMHNGVTEEQIIDAWMSVLRDTPTERINVLKSLNKKFRTFLLSNTNKIHADKFNKTLKAEQGVNHYDLFEKVYYSHELKLRKPGKKIFQFVIEDSSLHVEETLFIDDTEDNIDTANELGLIAFHMNSHNDIAEIFQDW